MVTSPIRVSLPSIFLRVVRGSVRRGVLRRLRVHGPACGVEFCEPRRLDAPFPPLLGAQLGNAEATDESVVAQNVILLVGPPEVPVVPHGLWEEGIEQPVLHPVPHLLVGVDILEDGGLADLVNGARLPPGGHVLAQCPLQQEGVLDANLVEENEDVNAHEDDVHDPRGNRLHLKLARAQPPDSLVAVDLHIDDALVDDALLLLVEQVVQSLFQDVRGRPCKPTHRRCCPRQPHPWGALARGGLA
mmetsp:Transcript_18037/g.58377  ORF Transcript_18037/g.58377 Transcript_18037/m.58377 type:complete len:245 (-) Transcript_18037:436-1170(-)